ncbi:hypothetical protein CK203_058269 [Vitis vinifera]|uniref:Uncharacterized protein n=1 Tax=Vitis vinifera TaxID=29760 RepID=A0A438FTS9_VITVI|nr:hypothetical protein CK203_058269 [Vitis vinifera]
MRDYNRGGCFLRLGLWIWRERGLASLSPKEEEQRVVGPQWWKHTVLGLCRQRDEKSEGRRATVEAKHGEDICGSDQHGEGKGESNSKGRGHKGGKAEQASKLGSISVGGIFLRLEKWRPETRCLRKGRTTVKLGCGCGHELLVKRNGEALPNAVEVWVEELCYSVTLWWEVRPVMKVTTTGKRGKASQWERSGSRQITDLTWSDDGLPGGPHVSVGWLCWAKQSPLGELRLLNPLGFLLGRLILRFGSPLSGQVYGDSSRAGLDKPKPIFISYA